MSRRTSLDKWLGLYGPKLDPRGMEFVSKPGKKCGKCLFDGQLGSVCRQAGEEARRRGIEDCDSGVIYVTPPPRDERQTDIFEG